MAARRAESGGFNASGYRGCLLRMGLAAWRELLSSGQLGWTCAMPASVV